VTNKQLASARRAFRQFPGATPIKRGETIIPVFKGGEGEPIEVTEAMSPAQVEQEILTSCEAYA
jgi:hypothetical protein